MADPPNKITGVDFHPELIRIGQEFSSNFDPRESTTPLIFWAGGIEE